MTRAQRFDAPFQADVSVDAQSVAAFKSFIESTLANEDKLADVLMSSKALRQRYSYDKKTRTFSSHSGSFEQFANEIGYESAISGFMSAIKASPTHTTFSKISESDLIKYTIACHAVYKKAARKYKEPNGRWYIHHGLRMLDEVIKSNTYTELVQQLDHLIEAHKGDWSTEHRVGIENLLKTLHESSVSLDEKIILGNQLIVNIAENKPNTTQNDAVFQSTTVIYEERLDELSHSLQPMLYYPKNTKQQLNIRMNRRHCYYMDTETKVLTYVNAYGTITPIEDSELLTREVAKMAHKNGQWILEYAHPKYREEASFHVSRQDSALYGVGFQMTQDRMKKLIPSHYPQDPMLQLAQEAMKNLSSGGSSLQRLSSYLTRDQELLNRQRLTRLTLVHDIINRCLPVEIRTSSSLPKDADFEGEGASLYVLVGDVSDPSQSGLWHIDRSNDRPKFTKLSVSSEQLDCLQHLFMGAAEKDTSHSKQELLDWYQSGLTASSTFLTNGASSIPLTLDLSKRISKLLLSDSQFFKNFVDDYDYATASCHLTDILSTVPKTELNARFLKRCHFIQTYLDSIGNDFYKHYPETRWIVSIEHRIKILEVLAQAIINPHADNVKHYLRVQHRIYYEPFKEEHKLLYEPSSFVWDENKLYYVNEHHEVIDVAMTPSMLETLQRIEEDAQVGQNLYISTSDVYELMTKPKLFSYQAGFPVGIETSWIDSRWYNPFHVDRTRGLHTGTAQEMLLELYDRELSNIALLHKLCMVIADVIIPGVLAFMGNVVALGWLLLHTLSHLAFHVVMIVVTIKWCYEFIDSLFCNTGILDTKSVHLDKTLEELGHELDKIREQLPALEEGLGSSQTGAFSMSTMQGI